jgi:hypothetical protein
VAYCPEAQLHETLLVSRWFVLGAEICGFRSAEVLILIKLNVLITFKKVLIKMMKHL